jgi:hypothetical protein
MAFLPMTLTLTVRGDGPGPGDRRETSLRGDRLILSGRRLGLGDTVANLRGDELERIGRRFSSLLRNEVEIFIGLVFILFTDGWGSRGCLNFGDTDSCVGTLLVRCLNICPEESTLVPDFITSAVVASRLHFTFPMSSTD